jgi:hypothetical protein
MAEINPGGDWLGVVLNLASGDTALQNAADISLRGVTDNNFERRYLYMLRSACEHYGLDPDEYADKLRDACEFKLLGSEVLYE